MEELEVLRDIVRRLDDAEIPYMVTGSMALSFYVRPRMTRDIDIVIFYRSCDVNRLVAALEDTYYIDPDSAHQALLRTPPAMFNVIHEKFVIKVDLIVRHNTEYAYLAFERRRYYDVLGQKVSIIAPEDLVLAKLDWAQASRSELQLDDIRALLRNSEIDKEYIETWVRKLQLDAIWEAL